MFSQKKFREALQTASLAITTAIGVCLVFYIRDLERRLKDVSPSPQHKTEVQTQKSVKGQSKKKACPPPSRFEDEGPVQKTMHKQTVGIIDKSGRLPSEAGSPFVMEEIGQVRSNFPHRAGCPRQGTLAPHARSHLVMHPVVAPGSLDGLEAYSHVWVLFKFHINIVSEKKKKNKQQSELNGNSHGTKYSAKVKPPRACGKKVGVFSTRSPHRPNPVGLSLCLVERIDHTARTLHLLGLDLVDGTPVYDIKPYIPWDSVGGNFHSSPVGNDCSNTVALLPRIRPLSSFRVPDWVTANDGEFARVVFTPEARASVAAARARGLLHPLYPPLEKDAVQKPSNMTHGGGEEDCEVCAAVCEVVAQDPRSSHDGRGKPTAEAYGMTFNALRVSFVVNAPGPDGCATAVVVSAEEDPGDESAPPGAYQHSKFLRHQAEAEAAAMGRRALLAWRFPIREGVVQGLLDLKGGGTWKLGSAGVTATCNEGNVASSPTKIPILTLI